MELRLFVTVFTTIFLAELGDKTQLATLLYAADAENSKWIVFGASAFALILTSALAVLVGSFLSSHLNPRYLSWIAGVAFIGIGVVTIAKA